VDAASADVKTIFGKALEIESPEEQAAYLAEACGANAVLRAEVEELLQALDRAGKFLSAPAVQPQATVDSPPITEKPGAQIGPYKLLQQIGEGGMGVVYMAEQSEPVERRVALKIIKPGMDTKQVIARFEAERQALAMMDHPNIAHVLDAGATESGRPYFVMELVNGVRITEYCDEKHLTTRERLDLFVPVCQAVQHAHQKGIIHRDLKPSNVLVAHYDDKPVPKIIDFGVAKATNQKLTERTMFTEYGQIVGTLEYMSPEQARLNQLDIDTRSDIYSLGVLLYELLTGSTPFERARLHSAAFEEMLRIIREEEPPKPSTRLSGSDTLPSIAANRHTEPHKLASLVRGDLDWIVMKALEKDRARRYETASGFVADIQRFLQDEPVLACPPSAAYKFRKLLRRNKRMLATAAGISAMIAIASSLGILAHQRGLREEEARRLAAIAVQKRIESEEEKLRAELDALVEEALRLGSGQQPNFEEAVKNFTQVLQHRPDDAAVYLYRGSAYYQWGKHDLAIKDLEEALDLQPENNPAAHWLIALAAQGTDHEKSRRHERLAKESDPESVQGLVVQARALQHDERAIDLISQAIDRDPFDALLYFYRGDIYYNLTITTDRPRYYEPAVSDLEMALLGRPGDTRILATLCGALLHGTNRAASTRESLTRAKELASRLIEIDPQNAAAWWLRGKAERNLGEPRKAIGDLTQAIKLQPDVPHYRFQRVRAYHEVGQREQAEFDSRKAIEILTKRIECLQAGGSVLGPSGFLDTAQITYHLRGHCYQDFGDLENALADYTKASQLPPESAHVWGLRASVYRAMGQWEDARAAAERTVALNRNLWDGFFERGVVRNKLGQLDQAIEDLSQALKLYPHLASAHRQRAIAYSKKGQWDLAARDLEKAVRLEEPDLGWWRDGFHVHYDELAVTRLVMGEMDAYRAVSAAMLEKFADRKNPLTAQLTAWTCALAPDCVNDYEPVITLARRAVAADPSDRNQRTLAAALLRAGRLSEAVERLTEIDQRLDESASGSDPAGYVGYLLAIGHQRAENTGLAGKFFDKAVAWSEAHRDDDAIGWFDSLTLSILRREAEGLLDRDETPIPEFEAEKSK
jgi:serine/threonine protein kinase/Flp pilus assembly protein TadD